MEFQACRMKVEFEDHIGIPLFSSLAFCFATTIISQKLCDGTNIQFRDAETDFLPYNT